MDRLESNGLAIQWATSASTSVSSTDKEASQKEPAFTAPEATTTLPVRFVSGSTCPAGLSVSRELKVALCVAKALAWLKGERGFACNRRGGCPSLEAVLSRHGYSHTQRHYGTSKGPTPTLPSTEDESCEASPSRKPPQS